MVRLHPHPESRPQTAQVRLDTTLQLRLSRAACSPATADSRTSVHISEAGREIEGIERVALGAGQGRCRLRLDHRGRGCVFLLTMAAVAEAEAEEGEDR